MPVLRAHLIQIKILENHQNGKDTHLRGLQVFARDEEEGGKKVGGKKGKGKGKAKQTGKKVRLQSDDHDTYRY